MGCFVVPSADERFRAKVGRRDGHEVWTGSVDARGVGMVRIDGKLRTVQRAAWEFAYGPLPHGARVNSCAVERACASITVPDAERVLAAIYRDEGTDVARCALELLRDAYRWAIRQGWCTHNPLDGITGRRLR